MMSDLVPAAPQLVLLKQTSLCEDVVTKNGAQKSVHIVVKNSPFCVTFGFVQSNFGGTQLFGNSINHGFVDLHKLTTDVRLIYDANVEKDVDFVKEKPYQCKSTINQNGTKLTLEVRIKVLTSQLEDMLFRVGVSVLDPITQHKIYQVYSEPIKVISKSDQVKKKKPPRKKRNVSDFLTDALYDIESRQEEQSSLLEKVVEQNHTLIFDKLLPLASMKASVVPQCPPSSLKRKAAEPLDFATAFGNFLNAYDRMSADDKKRKVTGVIDTNICSHDNKLDDFASMMELIWKEGVKPPAAIALSTPPVTTTTTTATATTTTSTTTTTTMTPVHSHPHSLPHQPSLFQQLHPHNKVASTTTCPCADCPYKKELATIEHFYEDIFSLGT